jgi:hypothetical protein
MFGFSVIGAATSRESPNPMGTPITVNGHTFRTIPLDAVGQVKMICTSWAEFVIFLMIYDLPATICNSSDGKMGSFNTPTTTFAFYFHEPSDQVVFTATERTTLQFLTSKLQDRWNNGCRDYYLSSTPQEVWNADQTGRSSQDICLFHVSHNIAMVASSFDTQNNRDYQDIGSSGSATKLRPSSWIHHL